MNSVVPGSRVFACGRLLLPSLSSTSGDTWLSVSSPQFRCACARRPADPLLEFRGLAPCTLIRGLRPQPPQQGNI